MPESDHPTSSDEEGPYPDRPLWNSHSTNFEIEQKKKVSKRKK